jgi:predicted amidophosphoribosyltransferase
LEVPYWSIILIPLVPIPFLIWRKRSFRKGFCANCGYDLRASTGRCPECGIKSSSVGRGKLR